MAKKSGAIFVFLGIFLSRIAGLIRERAFAHYFGNSPASDAFKAALRIPNFLQNLFGEGVLSASFIPIYAKLVADNKKEEARCLAWLIFTVLVFITSIIVTVGIFLTPSIVQLIAPGFQEDKKLLTIKLVQIFFPGMGLLVISAWCLGILNSHRQFFLSYFAPVLWNLSIIASLIYFGQLHGFDLPKLSIYVAWGLFVGCLLQLLVQIPQTLKLIASIKFSFDLKNEHGQMVIKNFFPILLSRGVVQASAYIDGIIASFLPTGAVAALSYAQTLYLLPISLFGMSIAASELPVMSSLSGTPDDIYVQLKKRLEKSSAQLTFFIIPSVAAFIFLGSEIVSLLFKTGQFSDKDVQYVWFILIGSTLGLLATTQARLLSSAFYALKDGRTPLKIALVRLFLTATLGYLMSIPLIAFLKLPTQLGAVGLTISFGIAGWIEFLLLKHFLSKIIGSYKISRALYIKAWASAIAAALIALFAKYSFFIPASFVPEFIASLLMLFIFGCLYFLFSYGLKIDEARLVIERISMKLK